MNLGGGARVKGKDTVPPPNTMADLGEAFSEWMTHYRTCSSCIRAPIAEDDYLCPRGERVRRAAIKELTSTMPKAPKKEAADTPFNPSIASKQR